MKCPKCHYLSFDPEPRCRNCGFTLSLDEHDLTMRPPLAATDAMPVDLSLRRETDVGEGLVADVLLSPSPGVAPDPFTSSTAVPSERTPTVPVPRPPRKVTSAPTAPPESAETRASSPVTPPRPTLPSPVPAPVTTELPLFVKGLAESDSEHAMAVAVERPVELPIVVATPRATVEPRPAPEAAAPARRSGSRKLGPLDRDLLEDLQRFEQDEQKQAREDARSATARALPGDRAGIARRLGAAIFDATFMGSLGAGTLWVTLRWCELTWDDLAVLPVLPTAAFLLLIGVGYLLMFTAAGGQTIGKMLAGIRVVGAGSAGQANEPLSLGRAIYREVVVLPSVLVFGIGFVPALMGQERAVHDRLAQTRVVRA